jgi:hypothetical protein
LFGRQQANRLNQFLNVLGEFILLLGQPRRRIHSNAPVVMSYQEALPMPSAEKVRQIPPQTI